MKSKGQALVEFIIILPVFLLLVLGVIDIGKIVYFGNILEHRMDDVVKLYKEDKTIDEINNLVKENDKKIELRISTDEDYVTLELVKDLEIVTPGLNLVFDNPYEVIVKRVVINEE